jgi:hypothetical protein
MGWVEGRRKREWTLLRGKSGEMGGIESGEERKAHFL